MKSIVGVRLKKPGKIYFFDPGYLDLKLNDKVIVVTALGEAFGEVAIGKREFPDDKLPKELKKVKRIATEKDIKHDIENHEKEDKAIKVFDEKIAKFKLNMKSVDCEYVFDNSKIIFYFTSDERVDFRELVKDLASIYKTRIELRQIGVRDEVRRIGGNGVCGRELCCCTFLKNFEVVPIKAAKDQSASLNPSKISGNCGRLMCCLRYEKEVYDEKLKNMPKVGAIVKTEDGEGKVISLETLKECVRVQVKKEDVDTIKSYPVSEITIIKNVASRAKLNAEEAENLKELKKLEKLEKEESKNTTQEDDV